MTSLGTTSSVLEPCLAQVLQKSQPRDLDPHSSEAPGVRGVEDPGGPGWASINTVEEGMG